MEKYTIHITPQPTPRPRLGRYGVHNTTKYTKYKEDMAYLLKELNIPTDDYDYIHAIFYFPYTKSTAKKRRIEGAPKRDKCDNDNLVKGLLDVLEKIDVVENDRQFTDMLTPIPEKNYLK
jgi:Holliday junction resolvase RusA-like endonuclease